MKLTFPNPSRSFDESGKRVRFWGYDRAIEVSFFVEAEALNGFVQKLVRPRQDSSRRSTKRGDGFTRWRTGSIPAMGVVKAPMPMSCRWRILKRSYRWMLAAGWCGCRSAGLVPQCLR